MMNNSPHYQHGESNELAFVFACPGLEEERAGRPVSGKTGKNLQILLDLLNLESKDLYRITNSVATVYPNEKSKRTQPYNWEIRDPSNIERLYNELKDIDRYIVFFGEKAAIASEELKGKLDPKVKCFYHPHLGLQAINQIRIGSGIAKDQRTLKRLSTIAEKLKKDLTYI